MKKMLKLVLFYRFFSLDYNFLKYSYNQLKKNDKQLEILFK